MKKLLLVSLVVITAGCATVRQDIEPTTPYPKELVFPPLPGDHFFNIEHQTPLSIDFYGKPKSSITFTYFTIVSTIDINPPPEWNIQNYNLEDHLKAWEYHKYDVEFVANRIVEDKERLEINYERVARIGTNSTTIRWITPKWDWSMTNSVWWMKYHGYEQNESNSFSLSISLWASHGQFSLVWQDTNSNVTYLATSNIAEGEGFYKVNILIDRDHPVADKILSQDGILTTIQQISIDLGPPEFGTWYAIQNTVQIYYFTLYRGVYEIPIPVAGFPTKTEIIKDPDSDLLTVKFQLYDEYGYVCHIDDITNLEDTDFVVEMTTNLVTGVWQPVGNGTTVSIFPEHDTMFFRLHYK